MEEPKENNSVPENNEVPQEEKTSVDKLKSDDGLNGQTEKQDYAEKAHEKAGTSDAKVEAKTGTAGQAQKPESESVKNGKKKRSFGSIFGFDELKSTFKRTKEENKNVKKYAILGIIFSVCAVALVFPCFFGGIALFKLIGGIFTSIFGISGGDFVFALLLGIVAGSILGVLAIAIMLLPFVLAVFALILPIFQVIVNGKWWAWVGFVLGVATVPVCVYILTILIGTV
jgi:cation transport ATPase